MKKSNPVIASERNYVIEKEKFVPVSEYYGEDTFNNKVMKEKLKVPISELELSVRSSNCLREAKIKTVGDLVKRTELEMLHYRNFGKKSLTELEDLVQSKGLEFGMSIAKYKLDKE